MHAVVVPSSSSTCAVARIETPSTAMDDASMYARLSVQRSYMISTVVYSPHQHQLLAVSPTASLLPAILSIPSSPPSLALHCSHLLPSLSLSLFSPQMLSLYISLPPAFPTCCPPCHSLPRALREVADSLACSLPVPTTIVTYIPPLPSHLISFLLLDQLSFSPSSLLSLSLSSSLTPSLLALSHPSFSHPPHLVITPSFSRTLQTLLSLPPSSCYAHFFTRPFSAIHSLSLPLRSRLRSSFPYLPPQPEHPGILIGLQSRDSR